MDDETRQRAHLKLNAIKDYIGYPEEILVNSNLEELYAGLQISPTNYFQNGINMSIWSTNYHWKKLREKVRCYDALNKMLEYNNLFRMVMISMNIM